MRKLLLILVLFFPLVLSGQIYSGVVSSQGGGSSYCAEYQAVLNAMTTDPSPTESGYYNTFIVAAKAHGYWTILDWLSIFAVPTNTNSEALINWIAPGTNNPALVSTPTFTAYEGFTGNASSTGVTSSWNPTNDGVNYTLDASSFGIYIRNDVQTDNQVIGATNAANNADIIRLTPRNAGNAALVRINTATGASVANASSIGFYMINRTAANATSIWKNGSSIDTDTNASSEMTTNDIGILFRQSNTRAYWTAHQVSMVYFAGVLTDQNKIDFNADFEALMDSLGKGIEP